MGFKAESATGEIGGRKNPSYQLVNLNDEGRPVYTVGRCYNCGNEEADGSMFLGGIGWVVACCR